jgi:hypothetical protein
MDKFGEVPAVIAEEFTYLWTDPGTRYVVVRLGEKRADRVIWDRQLHGVLVIEDDDTHRAVLDHMEQNGVPVLDGIPK